MSELQFAKSFLTTLDNKSTKYQPDHVFPPATFATRIPYTLPRLPHPPHPLPPKTTANVPVAPGSERVEEKFSVVLKSSRNPNMNLTISDVVGSTSVQSLRDAVQSHLGGAPAVGLEKIKILLNKKPIPSSKKTVKGAFEGSGIELQGKIDLGVFIMGGAKDPVATAQEIEKRATPVPPPVTEVGPMEGVEASKDLTDQDKTAEALAAPEFWSDLEAFLNNKLTSPEEAKKLRAVFENAYNSTSSAP